MAEESRDYAGYTLMELEALSRQQRQEMDRWRRAAMLGRDVETTTTKALDDVSLDDIDGVSLRELGEWVNKTVARVPDLYRNSAWIEFDRGDEDTPASLNVFWEEPRPQADIDADLLERRSLEQMARARREAEERQMYEALRAKFEGKESE
jgi:hypothetical protein